MRQLKCIIVGTGRSGTGFLSNLISQNVKPCGHEKVFNQSGYSGNLDLEYEASWFAVPYLPCLNKNTKVLHVTRNPNSVIRSFYRLGAFAANPWPNFTQGKPLRAIGKAALKPRHAMKKLFYFRAQKNFLRCHTHCLEETDELKRIERYWCEWNKNIEASVENFEADYMRIRIEDAQEKVMEIMKFLEADVSNIKMPTEENLKKNVKRRSPKKSHGLDKDTQELASAYGYST